MPKILDYLAPFQAIAKELKTIRELYELELASRERPVIRVTEEPSKHDTEVFYGDEDIGPKSKLRRLMETWSSEAENDEN